MRATGFRWLGSVISASIALTTVAAQSGDPAGLKLPLAPLGPVSFTTTQGTWVSLDVSPDGRRIVFDLVSKIFVLPIEGGKAQQLTFGPSCDERPKFTRDGMVIVFSSDRGGPMAHWSVAVGGGEPQLASPEQAHGVYLASEPTLPNTNSAGTGRDGTLQEPTFSPDGRYGVRSSRLSGAMEYATEKCQQQAEAQLILIDRQNGSERALADAGPDCNTDAMPLSAFTPDSRAFITSYGGKIWRIAIPSGRAAEIPFSANVTVQVRPRRSFPKPLPDEPRVHARVIEHARVSPDGKWLAFGALDRVWVQELPHGTPHRLTDMTVGEFQPTWSPDSRHVAFTTWASDRRPEDGALWQAQIDSACVKQGGCPRQRLTAEAVRFEAPVYLPGGQRIAVVRSGPVTGPQFVSVSITGGDPVLFGPTPDEAKKGNWYFTPLDNLYVSASDPNVVFWSRLERERPLVSGKAYTTDDPMPKYVCAILKINIQATAADSTKIEHLYSLRYSTAGQQLPWADSNQETFCAGVLSPDGTRALVRRVNGSIQVVELPPHFVGKPLVVDLPPPEEQQVTPSGLGGESPEWRANGLISYSWGDGFFQVAAAGRHGYEPVRQQIDASVPRRWSSAPIVFRNARLITMRGDEVIEHGDLVVRGRRIIALGPTGKIQVPAGARVIDATGLTIMPGLLDLHNHVLCETFRPGVHDGEDPVLETNLAFGVLNSRDPQGNTPEILSIEDRIEAGDFLGPRTRNTFIGLGLSSREWFPSLKIARRAVHRYGRAGLQVPFLKEYVSGPRDHRERLVMAAAEEHLNMTSHGVSLRHLLTNAIDGYGGYDHPNSSEIVQPIYDDVWQLLAATGIAWADNNWRWALPAYFLPSMSEAQQSKFRRLWKQSNVGQFVLGNPDAFLTSALQQRKDSGAIADPQNALRQAAVNVQGIRRGVRMVNGSHGDDIPGLATHLQIWAYVEGGATPLEALRTSTLWSAEALDWGAELGSLEVGKMADIIVLDANPLERIQNTLAIRQVMSNGRLLDAETLQETGQ